ncbi:hypothetical protein B0H16DRAFT_1480616 [Mycena metata]|uniref:Uncharacterized protein n=1 Tax=Mycena metata TaxID=1033252 RepID=A0AAD7MCU6_9AGAR|nr:hypothetical protein B0H16DRAFT_1480616 [Mycena metata]
MAPALNSFQQRLLARTERAPGSRKHARTTSDASDFPAQVTPSSPLAGVSASVPATRNTTNTVQNFAKKQKLRGDQLTQVDTFLGDAPTVRKGKLFCLLLAMQNELGNIVTAAPPFAVSAELKVNIQNYAHAVLLSPKLANYRGDLPVQHVMSILWKHRFDLPPGIENNPAELAKIQTVIQEAFTQCRSTIKKKLFASVRVWRTNEKGEKVVVNLPADKHQNLFALAQALVDGTKCRITNVLCGRIALMRECYMANSSTSFWTDVDAALVTMRETAGGNDELRDDLFEDLIADDKEKHGAVDIIYQTTNDVQQEVDDLIDATTADAVSTPAPSTPGPSHSARDSGSPAPPEEPAGESEQPASSIE